MDWCCVGFRYHYEVAGERGTAILIGRDELGAPEVILQHRAADKGDETFIKSERTISLVEDVRIVYCPWCGRNAEQWYGRRVDELFREGLKITYQSLRASIATWPSRSPEGANKCSRNLSVMALAQLCRS